MFASQAKREKLREGFRRRAARPCGAGHQGTTESEPVERAGLEGTDGGKGRQDRERPDPRSHLLP